MVADETINRVITWLSWEKTRSQWFKRKVEDTLNINTSKHNWEEELGKAMFQLNIAGVNDRYGDNEAKKFRALNYRYTPVHGSQIQVLKSLQCCCISVWRERWSKNLYTNSLTPSSSRI
jgi:hypothetical protein